MSEWLGEGGSTVRVDLHSAVMKRHEAQLGLARVHLFEVVMEDLTQQERSSVEVKVREYENGREPYWTVLVDGTKEELKDFPMLQGDWALEIAKSYHGKRFLYLPVSR